MNGFGAIGFGLAGIISLLLAAAAAGMQLFALIDAVRHRPDAYVAAGKRTKTFWVAIVAVCFAVGLLILLSGSSPLNLFEIAAVVGAAVYLADVRPALQRVSGRGGSSSHQGPYGPW
ncbi:MAG TPA: DUF2516 family protein [Segeticoccus sp.]|jgi:hypothetical protein|nr:DUF2516 family protein [Segeticoccus sp.]